MNQNYQDVENMTPRGLVKQNGDVEGQGKRFSQLVYQWAVAPHDVPAKSRPT